MANNCIGVGFDMSCDGSGNTMDSGEYLQGVGLPLSGGVDGLDQTGMSASNCNSLATSHFQENNCEMMAGQEQLSRLSREATQRQSIPPLGPRATMRSASGRGFRKHSGSQLFPIPNTGCTIPSAINYNPNSEEAGTCVWLDPSLIPQDGPQGNFVPLSDQLVTCSWSESLGYYKGHTHIGGGSSNQLNYLMPEECAYINYGCTDPSANNYNPSADQDFTFGPSQLGGPSPTLCVYGGSVGTITSVKDPKGRGKRRDMRSASGTSNDFGGLSFQCQDEPFASVTGKGKKGYDEPDISSEPPWWALTALGWVAGLKKQKSCICPQQDGSSITLTDCNRLQPCEKCCTNSTGGYAGGGYDPNQSSLTEG